VSKEEAKQTNKQTNKTSYTSQIINYWPSAIKERRGMPNSIPLLQEERIQFLPKYGQGRRTEKNPSCTSDLKLKPRHVSLSLEEFILSDVI